IAQTSGVFVELSSISMVDANYCGITGNSGTLLETTDGGTNWVSQSSGTLNTLRGISLTDATHGTVVGYNSTILRMEIPATPTATAATAVTRYGFTANWNAVSGATAYFLDVANNASFTSFVSQNVNVGNVTTVAVNGLQPGYDYYYRVRAYNNSGSGLSSNTITVVTLPPSADLAFISTVDKANPINLEVLTYNFTVTNNGPDTAKTVVILATVPRGFKYGSSVPTGSAYDHLTGLWTITALAIGNSATLTVVDTVDYFNQAYDFRDFYEINVFTKNDATFTGSSIGGKLATGHDATIVGSNIGGQLRVRPTTPDVVVTGHDLNFQSGTVHNGNVVYGNTSNLPNGNVVYPNGSLVHASPISFAALGSYLNTLSTGLSGYTVNGATTINSDIITLTGTDIYLNVFSVTGAQFQAAPQVIIDVPKGSVAIINVDGATIQFGGTIDLQSNLGNFVLFNFAQAASLTFTGSSFYGTVLAPFANVQGIGTLFRGQLFSNNLNSNCAHQNHSFLGYVPLNRTISFTPIYVSSFSVDPVSANNNTPATVVINTTAPYGSTGNGTWTLASVLPVNEMVLSLTRLNATTILAGTNLGRIYQMNNSGVLDSVSINSSMTPVAYIHAIAVNDSGHIFAATESGLYRSTNGGTTWMTHLEGKEVRSVLFGSGGYIYAGTWAFGVYRSNDFGYTWTQKNDNIGSTVVTSLMDRSLTGPEYTVFAGTIGSGVSASFNFANSWMNLSFPYEFVTCMNKSAEGILFVGTLTDGVYRSYDNGNTWTKLNGLPDGPIYAVRVDSVNNIFVSSWLFGIYGSSDLGDSWSFLGLGGYGISATFPGPDNKLFAATANGKIFVNDSPLGTEKDVTTDIPERFSLAQNYPNPFNPTTTISFSIPSAERVTLKVFNILGKEVATLINSDYRVAGSYKVSFNAAQLPSGVYFYRVQAGKYISSKKMVLLK
ncbi:MAG: choice-of-anchor A family protein, partial [Ignavibacteriales bacterium]|nr:choice-of-anchor A family protein [Ignavibacteriales bacterium]